MYNCPVGLPWYKVVDEMSVDEVSVDELSWNPINFCPCSLKVEGVWSNADTCGQGEGVKDLADVRKMALFYTCFSMLCRHSLYGSWLLKYKLLFVLSDFLHRL